MHDAQQVQQDVVGETGRLCANRQWPDRVRRTIQRQDHRHYHSSAVHGADTGFEKDPWRLVSAYNSLGHASTVSCVSSTELWAGKPFPNENKISAILGKRVQPKGLWDGLLPTA